MNAAGGISFERTFESLTGHHPLAWQRRLFSDCLLHGRIPDAVDLPTGLGKTSVIALWLIARAHGAPLPRRLVYVVDRRAVVDQATAFAEQLRDRLHGLPELTGSLGLGARPLSISTLRGAYADNREWLVDPAAPGIIVGTVDMIGSRTLFEGYGVSRRMRPYHAGLLGADTLVVVDEAHLVPPFEALFVRIAGAVDTFGPGGVAERAVVPACRLLSLSATGRERGGDVFRLSPGDASDPVVRTRYEADKRLVLVEQGGESLDESLARECLRLVEELQGASRIVVFCTSRDTLEKCRVQFEREAARAGIDCTTALLVGARRARERSIDATWLAEQGFTAAVESAGSGIRVLFATSAGEVGVDLDADHMICDLVAHERMVQRLGRVNRRGGRRARVVVVAGNNAKSGSDVDAVVAARRGLLEMLETGVDGARDASPRALADLKARAAQDPRLAEQIALATTPVPLRPALNRATVDAWSMTSLDSHAGRPRVAAWLRGWVEEEPQTRVIWRRHLPVLADGRHGGSRDALRFFEAAPPHLLEILETETSRVVAWLSARAKVLAKAAAGKAKRDERADDAALEPGDVVAFMLESSGDSGDALTLATLAAASPKSRLARSLRGATLVVDARFAGLASGLLDHKCSDRPVTADDDSAGFLPEEAHRAEPDAAPSIPFRVRRANDSKEAPESDAGWIERFRLAIAHDGHGEPTEWLVVDKWRDATAIEDDRSASSHPQLLDEHQAWAERRARELASKLGLDERCTRMLCMAARLHDEGKRADRWQRAFAAPGGAIYAKTRGPISFALLDGYRHEFGSLTYAARDPDLQSLSEDERDLVLHLIAAHHGHARPTISLSGCEDAPPSALEARAREVALRFERLQRRWGPWGLAWWESLLRAADQQASRDNDARAR